MANHITRAGCLELAKSMVAGFGAKPCTCHPCFITGIVKQRKAMAREQFLTWDCQIYSFCVYGDLRLTPQICMKHAQKGCAYIGFFGQSGNVRAMFETICGRWPGDGRATVGRWSINVFWQRSALYSFGLYDQHRGETIFDEAQHTPMTEGRQTGIAKML